MAFPRPLEQVVPGWDDRRVLGCWVTLVRLGRNKHETIPERCARRNGDRVRWLFTGIVAGQLKAAAVARG